MEANISEQKKGKLTDLLVVLKKLTTEKYALKNQELLALDEYIRTLYIKLLCTVVQYENIPAESQQLYLKRVISGLEVEGNLGEYMRKSLDISETDLREFLSYMNDNSIRYYFVLDGLILSGLKSVSLDNREYLAQMIELCGVTKKELQQLCLIAGSVVRQDPDLFNEAKKYGNEKIAAMDLTPYVQNYYAGAIIDTDEEKYYSAPEKEQSEWVTFSSKFHAIRKVTFHNLKIDMDYDITFDSCGEVRFEDCDITGGKFRIKLLSCREVSFENCTFENFTQRVLLEEKNGAVLLRNCSFTDCVYRYSRNTSDWEKWGCVIHTGNSEENGLNKIEKCVFKNCGGRNTKNYYSSAFISDARAEVSGSFFYNCWHYYTSGRNPEKDPENTRRTMFLPRTPGEDNRFYDCAAFAEGYPKFTFL